MKFWIESGRVAFIPIEEGRTEIEAHITNLMTQFGLDEIYKKQLPDIPHAPTKRLDQSNG
ncbi:MAG: hypothetical protein IID44_29025 [Planctomycetes bacterium]|nr:hypothetical protein [Planctomycetota bacterium]